MADIDIGQITEALNDKMDRDGHNVQSPSAVIVAKQEPTADNSYTWYRKYSDGWVEQGKLNCSLPSQGANTAAAATFTLLVTMKNDSYHTTWARVVDGGNTYELTQVNVGRTTSNVKVWFWSTVATNGASTIDISIAGMAAN